jgi:hypothetical protein
VARTTPITAGLKCSLLSAPVETAAAGNGPGGAAGAGVVERRLPIRREKASLAEASNVPGFASFIASLGDVVAPDPRWSILDSVY